MLNDSVVFSSDFDENAHWKIISNVHGLWLTKKIIVLYVEFYKCVVGCSQLYCPRSLLGK